MIGLLLLNYLIKKSTVQGCTEIPGGRVSQAQNKVWKRDDEVWNLCHFRFIWHGCRQMCRQMVAVLLHMHSGFPAK